MACVPCDTTDRVLCPHPSNKTFPAGWCSIEKHEFSQLCSGLRVNGSIRTLTLDGNKIHVTALCDTLTKNANNIIARLSLWRCSLESDSAGPLGDIVRMNTSITDLVLAGNMIGEAGAEAIGAGLKCNRSLTKLDLWGCGIGSEGCGKLIQGISR